MGMTKEEINHVFTQPDMMINTTGVANCMVMYKDGFKR